jgi:hypothetical protein
MTAKEPEGFADFLKTMVEIANANEAEMDGTTNPVREIIVGADLVFGGLPQRNGINALSIGGTPNCPA